MDVLIKGIKKLPEDGDYIHLIIQNGKVHTAISCGYLTTDKLNVGTVVALPPHGRLIDADDLANYYADLEADNGEYTEDAGETLRTIQNAPTVLEAST